MQFDDLGLRPELLRAVREQQYTTPTPVQAQAIPAILQGRDIMAAAQTGTGKTAGFTLPVLQLLAAQTVSGRRKVRCLVLVPTRELAAQVAESVRTYGTHLQLRCAVIFGGVGIRPQIDALARGVDIVVATPGRLLDHVGQRTIDLSQVEILILDEADRMLDMGFIHDIKRVLKLLPPKRQTLLFSATFANEIKELADRLLDSPQRVEVARDNIAAELVEQLAYRVDRERKSELLAELIHQGEWSQVLVFTRTKHGANRLAEKLERAHITAAAIHGNKSQGARTRALAEFKQGQVRVLVATEIAARGLDIDQLPYVVNFELPFVPEDYVHRIGRTGRAGSRGQAVSLVCVDEARLLRDIERVLGCAVPIRTLPNFEPDPSIRPEPIVRGGGPRPSRRGPSSGSRDEQRGARRPRDQSQRSGRRS
ncbi:MAG: ATP-dependent RNA helicase RhlE [Gammaproteobacteria bacterium]